MYVRPTRWDSPTRRVVRVCTLNKLESQVREEAGHDAFAPHESFVFTDNDVIEHQLLNRAITNIAARLLL